MSDIDITLAERGDHCTLNKLLIHLFRNSLTDLKPVSSLLPNIVTFFVGFLPNPNIERGARQGCKS